MMSRVATAAALVVAGLAGCGGTHEAPAAPDAAAVVHWRPFVHVKQPVDITAPRSDGRLVVAANGRLSLLRPGTHATRFARGAGGYKTAVGPEPYIALSPGQAVPGAGCRFPRDVVYALEPQRKTGVVTVSPAGRAHRFVDLHLPGLPNGIAFDSVGRFGHRLLVTAADGGHTTVVAIDCRGRQRTVTKTAPVVEGGIVVAPTTFGRFAGRLIAPDEIGGQIFAIASSGRHALVAESGLPHGGDIGVESGGFAPPGFSAKWRAYLADRGTPGNPHPGDDLVLAIGGRELFRAGVRAGDLLLATEGGAQTLKVRCREACSITHVADGPTATHAEGHIVFARR